MRVTLPAAKTLSLKEELPLWVRFMQSDLILLCSLLLAAWSITVIGVLENSLIATWVTTGLLFLLGTAILLSERRPTRLLRLFWLTFGLRIAATLFLHLWLQHVYPGIPYWQFGADGGDENTFFVDALTYALGWQNGTILAIRPEWAAAPHFAWSHMLGFFRFLDISLSGDTVFNLKLVTCFWGALLVPYVYQLTKRIFEPRTALLTAFLAFWLPDYWWLSASLLRDVAVSSVGILFTYQVFAATRGRWVVWRFAAAAGLLVVLLNLRADYALALVAMAGVCMIWEQVTHPAQLAKLGAAALLLMMVVLIVPLSRDAVVSQVSQLLNPERLDIKLNTMRLKAIDEAADGSLGAAVQSLPVPLRLPLSAGQLLVPIPPWGSVQNAGPIPRALVQDVSAWVWLGLVVFLPAGILTSVKHRSRSTIWVWGNAVGLILALALSATIIPRWRLMAIPFLLILIAVGMESRRYRQLNILSAAIVVALLSLYVLLKYY
jgi:hypothetical protein